ncbi:MAG: PilZ domain-containing protein [Myxococcaceae bacterium]|nr:PilZ domain-containing protein [Myxococcaceae bacterium]
MSQARRQAKRVSIDVKFRGAGAATNLSGRITDLSEIGLFLATPQFVPLGKEIHVEFELPTGKVEAVGEVRWIARGQVAEQGLGIRFLRLSAASARAIDLAIDQAAVLKAPKG